MGKADFCQVTTQIAIYGKTPTISVGAACSLQNFLVGMTAFTMGTAGAAAAAFSFMFHFHDLRLLLHLTDIEKYQKENHNCRYDRC